VKEFFKLTEEFAKKIIEIENLRKRVGNFLRELSKASLSLDREILEEKIIIPVERRDLENLKIAGVDGGIVKHSLHGSF